MAGERSIYFTQMAERGAQRVVERLAMIAERYGKPIDPTDDVITFAEMMQHLVEFGHMPGDNYCNEKLCDRARKMVAGALAAVAQQAQQQQQQPQQGQ